MQSHLSGSVICCLLFNCKKHGLKEQIEGTLETFRLAQRKRLVEFMVRGVIEPLAVIRLLHGLDAGMAAGLERKPTLTVAFNNMIKSDFKPLQLPILVPTLKSISCRARDWRKVRHQVQKVVDQGTCLTVFRFSLSSIYHRMQFHPDGYWLQSGGIFGRADRTDRVFQIQSLQSRVRKEVARLAKVRPMDVP